MSGLLARNGWRDTIAALVLVCLGVAATSGNLPKPLELGTVVERVQFDARGPGSNDLMRPEWLSFFYLL